MEKLEELLLDDKRYYKQRAIEFSREFLNIAPYEAACENQFSFKDVYIMYDTSVYGHPLSVTYRDDETGYTFTVNNNEEVRVHSKLIESFFDEKIDQKVVDELKSMIRKIEKQRS